jgi:hypothetical protein
VHHDTQLQKPIQFHGFLEESRGALFSSFRPILRRIGRGHNNDRYAGTLGGNPKGFDKFQPITPRHIQVKMNDVRARTVSHISHAVDVRLRLARRRPSHEARIPGLPRLTVLFFGAAQDVPEAAKMVRRTIRNYQACPPFKPRYDR